MTEEARLQDHRAERADIDGDVRALDDLGYHWGPFWSFSVRYGREGAEWTARPADGSMPMTAVSAAELRAKLRQAAPVSRDPR